jgi:hypothetical protein
MAEAGYKFLPEGDRCGAFSLYHNEVAHSINALLLKSGRGDILYLGLTNPHFMYTRSESAIENAGRWLLMLQRNATPLTRESRKERMSFFALLQKKVARARLETEAIMKMNAL